MSLSPEEAASYTSMIDAILAASDLTTISSKKIRSSLQQATDQDLTQRKDAIKELIKERFERATTKHEQQNGVAAPPAPSHKSPEPSESASSVKREQSSDQLSDLEDDQPRKKKAKKTKVKDENDDAAYAARLQAELNSKARPTRGGGPKPSKSTPKKKKTPRKKSAAKITAEDDSDVDAGSDDANKTERGGAFNKPMWLSEPLKDLLGEESLSRPKTVKGIWAYIKKHDLQNPEDKRQIMCDERLRAVFKKDSVHMFTMNKILSTHLTPMDD